MANLDNIKRNSNDFSFVDTIGSFINNYKWAQGYRDFQSGNQTNKEYLWEVLSAIGNDYGQTIYENVLNYINNASNVDLCKVKALRSMATILGVKYQIFDNLDQIPIEILNLLDILSVNKKYLLDNKTFVSAFFQDLSSSGCILVGQNSTLSDEIQDYQYKAENNEISCNLVYLDQDKYNDFLKTVYNKTISKYIYLRYADAEADLSVDSSKQYIYDHIYDQLLGLQSTSDQLDKSSYDLQIDQLKIKYKLDKDFDQEKIVDDIEDLVDFFDNYSDHQQEVLSVEVAKRSDVYEDSKQYPRREQFLGYNITRYSYYREKKVKEYFTFVQNLYNNLITNADIGSATGDSTSGIITVYDKDPQYFNLNQTNEQSLITYDRDSDTIVVKSSMIVKIAQLLQQQTNELTEIREQLKIQLQKQYMKGTFLLLSYVINEFLKYNISNKFGSQIYTTDGSQTLKDILDKSITDGDNVELIEYLDSTEYFNIERDSDVSSLNSYDTNPKFWDNSTSKIGKTTNDIDLSEIQDYYVKQLQLDKFGVDDVVDFLSIIFEYGANSSFINKQSENQTTNDSILTPSISAFMCVGKDGNYLGDIDYKKDSISQKISSEQRCLDTINSYVGKGCQLRNQELSNQLDSISAWCYSNYQVEISTQNLQTYEGLTANLIESRDSIDQLSESFAQVSSDYEDLKSNYSYEVYLKGYEEKGIYLDEKIKNFNLSCVGSFSFSNSSLLDELTSSPNGILPRYNALTSDLINNVVEISVRGDSGLGYYSFLNDSSQEVDQQCTQIASYLQEKSSSIDERIQTHQQNHLDKLIQYKDDVNNMIASYLNAEAMLGTLSGSIIYATGSGTDSFISSVTTWGSKVGHDYWYESTRNPDDSSKTLNIKYWSEIDIYAVDYPAIFKYPALDLTHGLIKLLDSLNERCNANVPYDLCERGDSTKETDVYYQTSDQSLWSTYSTSTHYAGLTQKWKKFYSESSADFIKSTLNTLVSEFPSVLKLINDELDCIGSNVGSISISDVTVDNIGDKLQKLLEQLLDKISTYDDDYVKMQAQCSSDNFIGSVAGQIVKINQINIKLSQMQETISTIKSDFSQIRSDNAEYLSEYIYTSDGKVNEQVQKLVDWIVSNDSSNKSSIISQVGNLSSQVDDLQRQLKSEANQVPFSEITDIDIDKNYVVEIQTKTYSENHFETLYSLVINDINSNINIGLPSSMNTSIVRFIDNNLIQSDIEVIQQIKNDLREYLGDTSLVTSLLSELIESLQRDILYVEAQRTWYEENKTMFLTYSGLDIGDNPYYNLKNLTHPSYQIHPYLYNFVKKSNSVYPIANSFYQVFSEKYEQEIFDRGIDSLIGKYGNILNLWQAGENSFGGLYDWSGYSTQYEIQHSKSLDMSEKRNGIFGFTGLFYPPALDVYLSNTDSFIQKVRDNEKDSYYYHLNLTTEQLSKIADQLQEYEEPIRLIVQRSKNQTTYSQTGNLSCEYDIFKYGQDAYGNHLILLKNYKDLYEENEDDPSYSPSYNEKKNTLGELWMRIKNHPIAFPAFDLRSTYDDVSQYNIKKQVGKSGSDLNGYIALINSTYNNVEQMKDAIGVCFGNQFLRCFYDMEFEVTNRSLLLNVPYYTGYISDSSSARYIQASCRSYSNSSVIVGTLEQEFDYYQNITVYSFTQDGNIDNIPNKGMILSDSVSTSSGKRYDFLGFNRGSRYTYCIFLERKFTSSTSTSLFPKSSDGSPIIRMKIYGYKYNSDLYQPTSDLNITDIKYDIFDKSNIDETQLSAYKYVDNIVSTCDGENITIAYVSEQVQPPDRTGLTIRTKNDPYNKNNTTVVTYPEYTNIVDNNEQTAYGENTSYPRSTAILQTDDDQHIVVYNSFDSFTSYIVMIQLKIVGHVLKYSNTRYYNLNTDIGFIPLFADSTGKTRFYSNSSISGESEYNIQLLGPEKAEVNSTPVIVDTTDEKYGRVTEDYKEYNKFTTYTDKQLSIHKNEVSVSYTFELSDALSAVYEDIIETNELTKYKYMLFNNSYQSIPIAKGSLSNASPDEYFYNSDEAYDVLSGEEILGPNGVSFQDVGSSNHINNISAIQVQVNFDINTLLPKSMTMACYVRQTSESEQVIDANKFQLLIYNKNNVKSYEFYHLFQNSNSNAIKELVDQLSGLSGDTGIGDRYLDLIDFSEINSLSTYSIPGTTIQPFKNYALSYDVDDLSALLEFKYSEENTINLEFPYLDKDDVQDEITIATNDSQYIYYFSLDGFSTIDLQSFQMEKYDTTENKYVSVDINTSSSKYEDFYNRSLTIEATYNVEVVDETKKDESGNIMPGYYGLVLYFNYKNYTQTQYVNYTRGVGDNPPSWKYCDANDQSIKNTYLVLQPGQSGRLDIRIDHVEFDKFNSTDISQTIVGMKSEIICTYYILNTSQDKPKFKISRQPFSL